MINSGDPKPDLVAVTASGDLTFEIPGQLGVVLATVTAPAHWTLPVLDEFIAGGVLIITNVGTATVTLAAPDPIVLGDEVTYTKVIAPGEGLRLVTDPPEWAVLGEGGDDLTLPLEVANGGLGTGTVPLDGQFPLGSGGSYVPTSLTAGTGLVTTSAAGSLSVALAVPVTVPNGGTGLTAAPASNTVLLGTGSAYSQTPLTLTNAGTGSSLVVSSAGTSLSLKTVSPGTNVSLSATGLDVLLNVTSSSTTISSETLTVAGGESLSTTITESILQGYKYSTLPAVTLGTPAADFIKRVTLASPTAAPVQVRTSRGSFLLSAAAGQNALLVYQSGLWAPKSDLVWFADTLQAAIGARYRAVLNANGDTLIGSTYNAGVGQVQAYLRTGAVWATDGGAFTITGNNGGAKVGTSLAVSDDGLTVAAGGPADAAFVGAIWIFVKSGGVWAQQGSKLVASGTTGTTPNVGQSVALAGDGNTLAAGAPGDNATNGAVFVWTRSGSTWTQRQKLTPSDAVNPAGFGNQVRLSQDGNTIAIAGFADNGSVGAVWVFTRVVASTTWTQVGSKLVYPGSAAGATQGALLGLSAAGTTLAFSVADQNDSNGVVAVYGTGGSSTWSLAASLACGPTGLIDSFALSANARTLFVSTDDGLYIFSNGLSWQLVGTTTFAAFPVASEVVCAGDGRTIASADQSTFIHVFV